MSVRAALLGITLTNTEISTAQQNGQDAVGMVQIAAQRVADAIEAIDAILDFIPSGSNKTTLQTQVTTLT